jgi:hypothetical protein
LQQPVQGPQVEMADRTRSEQQSLQGPGELDGSALQESDRSGSIPDGGSEVRSQYEEEHPAGNAVEQVIAASEERRKSEQHRSSVDGSI